MNAARTVRTAVNTEQISHITAVDGHFHQQVCPNVDKMSTLVKYIWMWGINPLVPGWSTRPEKTRFPVCLLLPYIGTWFSSGFWYRADF